MVWMLRADQVEIDDGCRRVNFADRPWFRRHEAIFLSAYTRFAAA